MKTMVCCRRPSRMLVQHGLQALFEFAAELGAREQRGHVERQHALALQRLGHLAGDDALREAFDDGGLAHAGFADQHRGCSWCGAAGSGWCGGSRRRGRSPGRACPARARSVRSSVYFFSASRWPSASALCTREPPRTASIALSSDLRDRPCSSRDAGRPRPCRRPPRAGTVRSR